MPPSEEKSKTETVEEKPLTLNRSMFNHFVTSTEDKMKYLDQVTGDILTKLDSPSEKFDSMLIRLMVLWFVLSGLFKSIYKLWNFFRSTSQSNEDGPSRVESSSRASQGTSSGIPQVVVENKPVQEASIQELGSSSAGGTSRKHLNIWQNTGLDVNDSTFSKALAAGKRPFSESKFDFSSSKVPHFLRSAEDRAKALAMRDILKYTVATEDPDVLVEGNLIVNGRSVKLEEVKSRSSKIWDEADASFETHDKRIKSNTFGIALLATLENSARSTIEANHKKTYLVEYEGESYVDGPLLMHCILMETKPPSHSAVQAVKNKIRDLNIKSFKYNLPKALNQMNKLLKELNELQGSMSETDKLDSVYRLAQQLDPDEHRELCQYVSILHREDDKARNEQRACRSSGDLMQELKDEWARLNPPNASKQGKKKAEDVDKKTLVNLISTLLSSSSTESDDAKPPKKKQYPEWKIVAPKNDEKSKEHDGRTYFWCTKCRNGKGLWAMHKTEEHTGGKGRKGKQGDGNDKKKGDSTKRPETPNGLKIDRQALTALKNGDVAGFLAQHPELEEQLKNE